MIVQIVPSISNQRVPVSGLSSIVQSKRYLEVIELAFLIASSPTILGFFMVLDICVYQEVHGF